MRYYIIFRTPTSKEFLQYYDGWHKPMLTLKLWDRMQYLSKESLMEDLDKILADKDIVLDYNIEIGVIL